MIVVDTSVWISAFRRADGREGQALERLLDADEVALAVPVRAEILSGASRKNRVQLRRVLSALPLFVPDGGTWDLLDQWVDRASDAGQRFGVVDLLIGAIAAERAATVWSLDADFGRMERLALIRRFAP